MLDCALSDRPDRAALVHNNAVLTYRQLNAAADRLASALGMHPGERVALVAPNVPALVVGLFAAWRAGAVAVPLSARSRRFELERAFADAAPAAAVSIAGYAGFELATEIERLATRTASLRVCAVVDDLGRVVRASKQQAGESPAPSDAALAAILYTSGTTGEPRGALLTHALAGEIAGNLADLLSEDEVAPCGLAVPVSHAFGLECLLAGIRAGAPLVLLEVMTSIDPLARALHRHEVAFLHASPALLGRLVRARTQLALRGGFVAGARCPPEVLRALDERGARILNLYGMTELGAVTACRREDPVETRCNTVGRALPGYEVRVSVEAASPPGEIQIYSAFLPTGYHGRGWSDEEITDDGWFRTGDLGELDARGNLSIAGRAKEVIHVGGFNVFPAEVESFLITHPEIAQAAVIGVAHPVLGEAPRAFVVPVADASIDASDVVRFARAGIAGYKVPYTVRLLDELPTLHSGKPDRRELARIAEREEAIR